MQVFSSLVQESNDDAKDVSGEQQEISMDRVTLNCRLIFLNDSTCVIHICL